MKLSFVCVGHNEIVHLRELLPSLIKISHEVIYVDAESSDGSADFARSVGCTVYSQPNQINVNYSRMFAFEKVTGDWIFYVDPDERFSPQIIEELRHKVNQYPQWNGYKLPRKNYFFGHWLKRGGLYPDHQIRIFKKGHGVFHNRLVHERIDVQGALGLLTSPMEHYAYRDISQFFQKFDYYTTYEANYLYREGVEIQWFNSIKFFIFKPTSRFFRRYILKRGFLDGIPGFFAALFDALGWAGRYFKLWEICKNKMLLKKSLVFEENKKQAS